MEFECFSDMQSVTDSDSFDTQLVYPQAETTTTLSDETDTHNSQSWWFHDDSSEEETNQHPPTETNQNSTETENNVLHEKLGCQIKNTIFGGLLETTLTTMKV